MRFWTVAWVGIDDSRLAVAYYGGLFFIVCYLVWNVIVHRGYLEMDPVQGVCRPHVEQGPVVNNASSCAETPCAQIPKLEVESGVSVGQVFVATHVRKVLQECADTFCLEPRQVLKQTEFFAEAIEDYTVTAECGAQAFHFFSQECQRQEVVEVAPAPLKFLRRAPAPIQVSCPFTTSNLRAQGRLLGPGGRVLREIGPGSDDSFSVETWLEAAGVHLGSVSDAPHSSGTTFRKEGLVLVVTVSYHNRPEQSSFWDLLSFQDKGSIKYDIKVQRVAEADYHVHRSTVTESTGWRPSVIESRTAHGILFRFVQTGQLGRFSWSALTDQIVLKLGLLTLLQLSLDLFWQYALPRCGIDYKSQVYCWVVRPASVQPAKAV